MEYFSLFRQWTDNGAESDLLGLHSEWLAPLHTGLYGAVDHGIVLILLIVHVWVCSMLIFSLATILDKSFIYVVEMRSDSDRY